MHTLNGLSTNFTNQFTLARLVPLKFQRVSGCQTLDAVSDESVLHRRQLGHNAVHWAYRVDDRGKAFLKVAEVDASADVLGASKSPC